MSGVGATRGPKSTAAGTVLKASHMPERESCRCRRGALLAAGSRGGGYQEGSSSRAPLNGPAEEIIVQQLTLVQTVSSSSCPGPENVTGPCAGVSSHLGLRRVSGQELQVWRQQQPSALVGLPPPAPCSEAAACRLPDTLGPCIQHKQQPSFSLPTNLFQFIKLTNRG